MSGSVADYLKRYGETKPPNYQYDGVYFCPDHFISSIKDAALQGDREAVKTLLDEFSHAGLPGNGYAKGRYWDINRLSKDLPQSDQKITQMFDDAKKQLISYFQWEYDNYPWYFK